MGARLFSCHASKHACPKLFVPSPTREKHLPGHRKVPAVDASELGKARPRAYAPLVCWRGLRGGGCWLLPDNSGCCCCTKAGGSWPACIPLWIGPAVHMLWGSRAARAVRAVCRPSPSHQAVGSTGRRCRATCRTSRNWSQARGSKRPSGLGPLTLEADGRALLDARAPTCTEMPVCAGSRAAGAGQAAEKHPESEHFVLRSNSEQPSEYCMPAPPLPWVATPAVCSQSQLRASGEQQPARAACPRGWASPPARQARRAVPPKKVSVPPQVNVDTAVRRACSPPPRSSGSGLSHADYRLQPVNWASLTLSSLQLGAPEAGLVAKFENIGSAPARPAPCSTCILAPQAGEIGQAPSLNAWH